MKTNRDIKILFENGLKFSTIKKLTSNQTKVLVERFTKKEEPSEAVTKTVYQPLKDPKDMEAVQNMVTKANPNASVELEEKFESTAQQKLFFVKCGDGKTKEQKKWCNLRDKFASSTTKKDYKKMPEKLHPEKTVPVKKRKNLKEVEYEKFLEKKLVNLIEKHVDPEMTKGDLIKSIMEKVNKSEKFILNNPKKNTMFQETKEGMMKKPIGNLHSISDEMKENTKEKERTKTRPDTDKKEKGKGRERKNPFEPKHEPTPKARKSETKEMYDTKTAPVKPGTKEKEKTKEPGRKNPFEPKHNPKPKAGKTNLPSWLSWNKLNINLK